ncbi:MAG TPA: acetyl-CoA carboxylase biotin carboxylase subunit [Bacteroidota bacterium]|nr:acetyl-CoA carboxylase biotin carboxylase subunit [Bacteroidota bacterium]
MKGDRRIRKLLVANRGEIALRIIRSASEEGIQTVAVYSDTDRAAPHVLNADEAYSLEGDLPKDTYLNSDKLIAVARSTHTDAIHPGYGFLSENADFADAVSEAGFIFVGPPASAIRAMGSKTGARSLMDSAGVPVVPGMSAMAKDTGTLLAQARTVGYPLLIKAVYGGGGKGMRKVEREDDLLSALRQAESEALKAFGNGDVYVEKLLESPRHIEIQILADNQGNVIYLGERECSIQRRHQKVIEECPGSRIGPAMREQMGRAAVEAARSCGYTNAGTIEFMVANDNFYFLEMNTRLQVEHPVTECVYGLDLVKTQLRIAEGKSLPISQEEIKANGHAIECRIYAEDPANDFLPSLGLIEEYAPSEGRGIRNDSGIMRGSVVSRFYDPLLAKLVAWGTDREEARRKMLRALSEYRISGVSTTIPFCNFALSHPAFIEGNYDIDFVQKYYSTNRVSLDREVELVASFVAASSYLHELLAVGSGSAAARNSNRWKQTMWDE